MSKKKKKKAALFGLSGCPRSDKPKSGNKEDVSCILERRLEDRIIPKVDDGIRDKDIKNPPPDVTEAWYQSARVGKYVHMEQVVKNGTTYTTKRVQFEFSRMLKGYRDNLDDRGVNPAIERLSFATISKMSFINNITNPLRYINYFIEYFDDDDELMRSYFYMMFTIMNDNAEVDLDPISFIESIYAAFTTDSMIEKIYRMVEYNVDDTMIKKTDRPYDESIQLTAEHLKAIMGVSCIHKFIIPLVSHYYNTKSRLLQEAKMRDKELYYYVFSKFIPVFDDVYGISLNNKLYHTATTRITKTSNQESGMWERRRRLGTTQVSYASDLMKDLVIDISQKAVFSKSAIVFIHVCMDKAIRNTLIQPDKWEFTEMVQESSDSVNEHPSRWDKWQTDKTFHSQKDRIRAYIDIKESLIRFGKEVGLDFKKMKYTDGTPGKLKDEYDYYMDNIPKPLSDSQMYFIQLYYSSRLGNTVDPKDIETPDIIRLIMIMKRDLLARNMSYLPFFISGKINTSAGKKYNKKRVERLMQAHPLYPEFIKEYEYAEGLLNLDKMINEARIVVACPMKIVDYKYVEMRGCITTPQEVVIIDDIMHFYCSL